MSRWTKRRANEAGYVAIMVAILLPVVFLGMSAIGVDIARWYVEVERVQKAADAGALGGVPYMPQDLAKATTTAKQVTARNEFDDASSSVNVTVAPGPRPSQLRVTVSSTIANTFGRLIGLPSTTITRTSLADFTGPAPMGSPCNTFGNEPPSQAGAAQPTGSALDSSLPGCTSSPKFWAAIEGPQTPKVQGDRYSTQGCGSSNVSGGGVYKCSGSNEEYRAEGYFFAVKVGAAAVGRQVNLQLYDPEFAFTNVTCSGLSANSNFENNMNPFVSTDGKARYLNNSTSAYCSGDYLPGGPSSPAPVNTSFALRDQTDSQDPLKAAVTLDTTGAKCIRQYRGQTTAPTPTSLRKFTLSGGLPTTTLNAPYNSGLAEVFHNWVDMCTFIPQREGDYYLQVRTNVALGGTAVATTTGNPTTYVGNDAAAAATGDATTGDGLNAFAMRAVPAGVPASSVSVAGWGRMPILQNAPSSTATFHLIRALPAAKGQFVQFDFYDGGDGASGSETATVQVLRPPDATGTITNTANLQGCQGTKNFGTYSALTNCSVPIRGATHDGQVQSMAIPLPSDYDCASTTPTGCWFQVKITFPNNVTDFTTWDGAIGGDPVRLIE